VVFLALEAKIPRLPCRTASLLLRKPVELKVRGLELPPPRYPAAGGPDAAGGAGPFWRRRTTLTSYGRKLEEAREILERYLDRVEAGQVSVEEIAISRRLTRAPRLPQGQRHRHRRPATRPSGVALRRASD